MRNTRNAPRQSIAVNPGTYGDLDWRFPDPQFTSRTAPLPEAPAICTRCHSYLETDHWLYGERRYRELQAQPDVHEMLCPGCKRVERRLYEGEVIVRHQWDAVSKQEVLNLIHNEEARIRVANPAARIALLEDRGDELYILTTTQFLAERIGKELRKSYHGQLSSTPLPHERFTRVRWER